MAINHLQKLNRSSIIILFLLFSGCKVKNSNYPIVNINIFGGYRSKERIKVSIENEVIFDKKIEDPFFVNRRLVYKPIHNKFLRIVFSVNQMDTSFTYTIKKENYIMLAMTRFSHQFLVSSVDSVTYWTNEK